MEPSRPGPRLSLAMVVRDEAEQLEACLASVAGFADELLVLDTGSSDGTVALAKRCGARVERMPWPGDFAPARNRCLELVQGDWVLVLDADERLLPEARQPLQQLMGRPELVLINLLRFEAGALQAPYSSVSRLFRRHPQVRWSGAYHAQVDDSVAALLEREPHWRVADCPVPALWHDGYRPERLADGRKAALLRRAMEAELARHPNDSYACSKLGALEVSEGRRAEGIALLERGLAHCPAEAVAVRHGLLVHLALALAAADPAAASRLYRQALALPLGPHLQLGPQLNLAGLLLESGELDEAEQLCRQACQAAPELAAAWSQLGLVLRRRGRPAEAIPAYERAVALAPQQPGGHQNLAVAQLLVGAIEPARQGFRRAIALLEQQGETAAAAALRQQAGALVKLDP